MLSELCLHNDVCVAIFMEYSTHFPWPVFILSFLISSVHPWISGWGGGGDVKDLLQTRKSKWSVFPCCVHILSWYEASLRRPTSSFSLSFLFFSQHQNQRFEKRNVTNPELVLMKDSCPWNNIFGQKAVDIVEAYVYILSIIHGKMFSHHLLC